jgi:hypothetical protein
MYTGDTSKSKLGPMEPETTERPTREKHHPKDYVGEEVLLVYDPDFKFGQNFVICMTEEAKSTFLKVRRPSPLGRRHPQCHALAHLPP